MSIFGRLDSAPAFFGDEAHPEKAAATQKEKAAARAEAVPLIKECKFILFSRSVDFSLQWLWLK